MSRTFELNKAIQIAFCTFVNLVVVIEFRKMRSMNINVHVLKIYDTRSICCCVYKRQCE